MTGLPPDPTQRAALIRKIGQELGFDKVGIAAIDQPPDLTGLQRWLASGYQAEMRWMETPKRSDPRHVLPGVRSLICVAMNYYTPVAHSQDPERGKISRYAWGRDYHRVLGKRLKALSTWIETQIPECQTRFYVDTGPIAEKAWAEQAGLGWIGKNSLLLTREYGSWVFLGVILTTLELSPDQPHTAHCGTCTRCITACPTAAIVAPHVVDSHRCIAYHTLESHDPELPNPIADHLQGWIAGCDICQDVCPWNQRFGHPTSIDDFYPYAWNVAPLLKDLAVLNEAGFDQHFPASALRRLKLNRLHRNVRAAQNHYKRDESPTMSEKSSIISYSSNPT